MVLAHQKTIETYNRAADFLIEHFEQSGDRIGDISLGFALLGNPEHARVLEIGCGYGRDARAIMNFTPYYTGLDASKAFLDNARGRLPEADFIEADAEEYDYPSNTYDIVFSFALLRHFNQEGVQTVLSKVYHSLRPGGIFYISLKFGQRYEHITCNDAYGRREVYLYNPKLIQKLAGPKYKMVHEESEVFDGKRWFVIALRKM